MQELKRILDSEVPRIENLMCKSRDYKRSSDSNADMVITEDESVVDLLNNKVREPRFLLFYPGALFASTVNTDQYAQSQTLMMLDVPSKEHIKCRKPLVMYAAPQNDDILTQVTDHRNPPTREELLAKKWTEVKVDVCLERLVTRAHVTASRRQYSLVHVGASTVRLFLKLISTFQTPFDIIQRNFCLENNRSTSKWVTHYIDLSPLR